jgi:DNA-directed RNA polymerase subunit N (RpoN/RPB10)
MPLRCFNCGMGVNHLQNSYEATMADAPEDADPNYERRVYEALGLVRDCCRVVLSRCVEDPRLRAGAPLVGTFTEIRRATREEAPPVTLPTDGTTDILDWVPPEDLWRDL